MTDTATTPAPEKIRCLVCEKNGVESFHHTLEDHLRDAHEMTLVDYVDEFGSTTPIISNEVWKDFVSKSGKIERKGTRRFENVLKIGDVQMERQDGDVTYKFGRPKAYAYPKTGAASKAVERVFRAFKYKRHLFIYGPAGAGKSAVIRALCHDLNMESSHYPMRDGLDPELYLGKEAVVIDEATGMNKTEFVKGKLLKDLEGREGADGVRRGVVILLDDFDRAPAEYHEVLRHALEDNARNVFIPELGVNVEVHPDTRIVVTANSAGRGDMTGYYTSVHELDESILDRFQRVVEFHFLEQDEEEAILRRKFPLVNEHAPDVFPRCMKVAMGIRDMISNNDIFASFSHRRIVQWLQSYDELLRENNLQPKEGMLKTSATDWLEWYDQNTRDSVISRVLDLHC